MWTVSCFLKVPLTAHYSKNSYNGEAALRNPDFHENEPHSYRGVGSALLDYAHLDVFHYANGCCKLCWGDQLCSACADGRLYRMVPEVVPTAYCAWIGARIKELREEGFDPLRIARIGGLLHWVAGSESCCIGAAGWTYCESSIAFKGSCGLIRNSIMCSGRQPPFPRSILNRCRLKGTRYAVCKFKRPRSSLLKLRG